MIYIYNLFSDEPKSKTFFNFTNHKRIVNDRENENSSVEKTQNSLKDQTVNQNFILKLKENSEKCSNLSNNNIKEREFINKKSSGYKNLDELLDHSFGFLLDSHQNILKSEQKWCTMKDLVKEKLNVKYSKKKLSSLNEENLLMDIVSLIEDNMEDN